MLGRPEWFQRRKYGGWGLRPKTWQGWVYLVAMLLPLLVIQLLPFWSNEMRMIFTGVWVLVLLIDVVDIMVRMRHNSTERLHEAVAERNAMWAIMMILVLGVLYDIVKNAGAEKIVVHPFIIAALVIGVLVKAVSNFVLERREKK